MTAPLLMCGVCGDRPATHIVEGNTITTIGDEAVAESHYEVACSNTFCLRMLAQRANEGASVHVDTHAIRQPACVDGLIGVWYGDEWEFFACSGCPGCEAA